MNNNSKKIFYVSILMLTIISCELEVPINEMIEARLAINRAREVKAEKYSKNNYDGAIDALKASHTYVKDEKIDDATKAAKRASRKANIAVLKSLPPLAGDTLNEARKILKEADDLNAEKNAAEEFKKAGDEIKAAEELNNNKKYWDSYLKSKEAIITAGSAMEKSLAVIPAMKSRLNDLYKEKDTLRSNKFNKIADAELQKADGDLNSAAKQLEKKLLKNLTVLLNTADENLKLARKKIEKAENNEMLKISTSEKISILENEVKMLNNSEGKEFAEKEINTSMASLNDAKSLLKNNDIKKSDAKVNEAENNINIAKDKIKVGVATKKLNTVEILIETVRLKDTKSNFVTEIERASILIAGSKERLEKKSYDDSIKKSAEAESILIVVKDALENADVEDTSKTGDNDKLISTDETEEKVYVVTYRKKKKDCLWRISLSVYNDAKLWPLIYKANRNIIKDPDLIFPGQKFIIPSLKPKKKMIDDKKPEKEKKESTDG